MGYGLFFGNKGAYHSGGGIIMTTLLMTVSIYIKLKKPSDMGRPFTIFFIQAFP